METTDVYEHSLSAETIANNVDILTEILLRVPAKSLVRFKCTSKHWLSLISNSKFCNDHTRKNLNPPVSGLYISCYDSRSLINFKTITGNGQQSLPKLDFLAKEVTILHSCNGLLLCFRGPEVIVCNPTVRKFKVAPSDKDRRRSRMLLSFSPSKSPYFKVVAIDSVLRSINDQMPVVTIDIYSSESGMWETIDDIGEFEPLTRYVLCDGALYWTVVGNNLMRFDIDAKTMTTHQTSPAPVIFGYKVFYFGGYGRYLTLVRSSSPTPKVFQILEMDTRIFRWIIKYDVDLGPVIDTSFVQSYSGSVYVLYLKGGDEKETPALLVATTQEWS